MTEYTYDDDNSHYIPVNQRQALAKSHMERLKQEGMTLKPLQPKGRKIAATFWGQAWCRHLANYTECGYRLTQARSYLKWGSILDLKVTSCRIEAKICDQNVHDTAITIVPIEEHRLANFLELCVASTLSMAEILGGSLPDDLLKLVVDPNRGLFPEPGEIKAICTCFDSAPLCTHASAALYGLGCLLDEDPLLFFNLRNIDASCLVSSAAEHILEKANGFQDANFDDLGTIFGIELESMPSGSE